uniref:FTH domain-containing protein n=1 Tax=Caenorhabditis tropicalis TaxID=1561998 RepID=A0A1I7TLC6_9PELO
MAANIPLSYPPMCSVLQFMAPHKRFRLAQQCPSLRNVEKLIPLVIDTLTLEPEHITINETIYLLGYEQIMDDKELPANSLYPTVDVISHNIDEYGFRVENQGPRDGEIVLRDEEGMERELSDQSDRFFRQQQMRFDWLDDTERMQLYHHVLRKNRRPPTFKFVIKLIERNMESHQDIVEYIDCTRSLNEAREYLISKFLGNRQCPVIVKNLEVPIWSKEIKLWLPADVTFKIHGLTSGGIVKDFLNAINIDRSSPLKYVEFKYAMSQLENLDHPVIESALKVIISNKTLRNVQWIPFLQKLKNRSVEFRYGLSGLATAEMVQLIREWPERKWVDGISYKLEIRNRYEFHQLQQVFDGNAKEYSLERKFFTLPLGPFHKLKISLIDPNPHAILTKIHIQVIRR